MHTDTIAAIATPLGAGAVGMVRLSGPQAINLITKVFSPHTKNRDITKMPGYTGCLGRAHEPDGAPVDDCVLWVYRAPKSYTGEDVIELCCHGGAFATRRVLRLCLDAGARLAEPGEFTRRAFLNGKLDLSQAEGIMDIIGAKGEAALKAALAGRDGALARQVDALADALLAQAAHLAAWADYPDEDLIPVDEFALLAALESAQIELQALLATYDRGKLLRDGAATAIVGKPNVGKSSLMNLLAGQDRSIVTDQPGTTRDIVQDTVTIGGITLNLLDTAGIRDTADQIEREGVNRSLKQLEQADLILAVFDRSDPLDDRDRALLARLRGKNAIAVLNKADLPPKLDADEIRAALPSFAAISAKTGEGRADLERLVTHTLQLDTLDPGAALVAGERQRACLRGASDALAEAIEALAAGQTLDAVNICIDTALDRLLSLTGRRATDAVIDEVFSRFCVGK